MYLVKFPVFFHIAIYIAEKKRYCNVSFSFIMQTNLECLNS